MSKDQIIDALGRIDGDIIREVAKERARGKPKRILRGWISIAACVVLICSAALTAEAASGSVSNLLAPLFGGAQTQIVDQIGIPVEAAVSVDGYTLTADAIIGDRYNVAIVYTLSRDDGQPVPENVRFLDWNTNILGGGSGGGSLATVRDEEDPNVVHFIESWSRQAPLIGRIVEASFSKLAIFNKDAEDTVLSEGTWELTYTLRYRDSSEKIPVKDLYVTDEGGSRYQVKKILLSPVGIHLDLILYDPVFGEPPLIDFEVSLLLTDGTERLLEGGGGGGMKEGDKRMEVSYSAMFDTPVPREDIAAIIICGTHYTLGAAE
ncbi:MAG: DUF4179 domain-containing protein [Oscillospiraceae bacterium]|nr:DUF4179 domain-containing protein [Oscillospiraceae bacterium]